MMFPYLELSPEDSARGMEPGFFAVRVETTLEVGNDGSTKYD